MAAKYFCADYHTPAPEGYLQWHSWATRMMKTHKQERCPICNLWFVWKLRKKPLSAVTLAQRGDDDR